MLVYNKLIFNDEGNIKELYVVQEITEKVKIVEIVHSEETLTSKYGDAKEMIEIEVDYKEYELWYRM